MANSQDKIGAGLNSHGAARNGNEGCLRALLVAGADVNAKDEV